MNKIKINFAIAKKIMFPILFIFVSFALGYLIAGKKLAVKKNNAINTVAPLASSRIDKGFDYALDSGQGKKTQFRFNLVEAKKYDLITRQGQPFKPKSGEVFLIITLNVENGNAFAIKVNSRDYVRWVDKDGKKHAPDLYNDAAVVMADSVKRDEIGFIIPSETKQVNLQIGRLVDKEKSPVIIDF